LAPLEQRLVPLVQRLVPLEQRLVPLVLQLVRRDVCSCLSGCKLINPVPIGFEEGRSFRVQYSGRIAKIANSFRAHNNRLRWGTETSCLVQWLVLLEQQ